MHASVLNNNLLNMKTTAIFLALALSAVSAVHIELSKHYIRDLLVKEQQTLTAMLALEATAVDPSLTVTLDHSTLTTAPSTEYNAIKLSFKGQANSNPFTATFTV